MIARTSRRALVGASAAAVFLMGSAGETKVAELDGRLLTLAADLVAAQARIEAIEVEIMARLDGDAGISDRARYVVLDRQMNDLQRNEFWPIADEIAATPARTPEGLQAKARAARIVWLAVGERDETSHPAQHFFGLVRDMLGEG